LIREAQPRRHQVVHRRKYPQAPLAISLAPRCHRSYS
jgi:hypothetical protein